MQNQRSEYYELLAPRASALDLSYMNHLLNFKAIEEPTKFCEMQQQLNNNCLGSVAPTFAAPRPPTLPDQPQSLNAQANDFIPNAKSSAAVTTAITKLEKDKRFFFRNGALYNRMCLESLPKSLEIEPNLKEAKYAQIFRPSNCSNDPFADDDHLLITELDFDDEYELGYDPMDAPIPNIKGICFQNPYFESDENMVDININNDFVPHLHFPKMLEKSSMAANTSMSGFANGLSRSKGYKGLQQHRRVIPKASAKTKLETIYEPQNTIQMRQSFNAPVYQRFMKTKLMESTDDDETLQNLRIMVDNLLIEPTQKNPIDKHVTVIKKAPIPTCFKENQGKDKVQHQQPPVRRGQGRSRSSRFTEIFGIYSPPTIRQHQDKLPRASEKKKRFAVKTTLSLFNDKPKPKDFPILTLPSTEKRLTRQENYACAQKNEWPSLPMGQ